MNLLEQLAAHDHEQVIAFQNRAAGLRGFLAIHDTTLGPALGGTRLWRYATEEEALADALRLSRAMTYKAALAELPYGGGKAVILDHLGLKRAEAFEAYGRLVGSLRGRFYTGTDVGVTPEDLAAAGRGSDDELLFHFGFQDQFPFGFQLAGQVDNLLLSGDDLARADGAEHLHIFLEHLGGAGGHGLEEVVL